MNVPWFHFPSIKPSFCRFSTNKANFLKHIRKLSFDERHIIRLKNRVLCENIEAKNDKVLNIQKSFSFNGQSGKKKQDRGIVEVEFAIWWWLGLREFSIKESKLLSVTGHYIALYTYAYL